MNHTSAYISEATINGWKPAKPCISAQEKGTVESRMKTDNNMQSASGLVSSANDLGNWLVFNINHGSLNKEQIHPANRVKKTHTKTISFFRRKSNT